MDLSVSMETSRLMKSFVKSCPPCEGRPPEWDVSFVLCSLKVPHTNCLRKPRIETSPLKPFLLTLAVAKRVGELHRHDSRTKTNNAGQVKPQNPTRGCRYKFQSSTSPYLAADGEHIGQHWRIWQEARVEYWTIEMLRTSYHLPFHPQPPTTQNPQEFSSYGLGSMKPKAFQDEVNNMMSKRAIEIISDN